MKNLFKITLLSFAALIAAPAIAQDTKSSTVEAFPVGKAPEVQVGQTYVVKQEGDWQIRCVKVEEGPEPCHMYQLVKDSEGNPVAEMNISHLPGGGAAVAGANVITPLGTLLLNQMIFKIDENEGKAYAFYWCEAVGCVARMGLTGLELESLKKGKQATITISSIVAPDKPLTLPVSLAGFSAAFSAILVKQ